MPRLASALFAVIIVVTPGLAIAGQTDRDAVRATFAAYKKALLAQNGPMAANLVDQATFAYYKNMRRKALHAKAFEVKRLNILDRLMVLALRVRVPVAKLRAMSAKQLFAFAVNKGMVGQSGIRNTGMGAIRVRGNTATANIINRGRSVPMTLHFRKENGRWKFQLVPLLKLGRWALKKIVKRFGKPENEVLITLLKLTSGRAITPAVWNPPN